jgi:hypothetical protein
MTNIDQLGGIGLWELLETLSSCRLVEKLHFEMGQVPGQVKGQRESSMQWGQGHQRGQR